MSHILSLGEMLDIKVFAGKAAERKAGSVREDLELRYVRFSTFLGNWSVSRERKRVKHTLSLSLTSFSKKKETELQR